jgi:hypothetical protein
VWDVRRVTGATTEEARALLDGYLARGIVTRGLCLKCSRCNYASWYSDHDVDRTFVCVRCRHEAPLDRTAWLKPAGEPAPYYQLDEIAFQALSHDAKAPLLALDRYRSELRGFLFAPEMDVFRGDERIAEVDLWVMGEASIAIGEAKSTDRLGRSESEERDVIDRLTRVAKSVTAHEIAFATMQPAWNERTRTLVTEIVGPTSIRPRFLIDLGNKA